MLFFGGGEKETRESLTTLICPFVTHFRFFGGGCETPNSHKKFTSTAHTRDNNNVTAETECERERERKNCE